MTGPKARRAAARRAERGQSLVEAALVLPVVVLLAAGVVAAGRLTAAQRASILADLESRVDDVVNGEFAFGFRGGPGGPPPSLDPNGPDA